jgi:beta-glucuronidase
MPRFSEAAIRVGPLVLAVAAVAIGSCVPRTDPGDLEPTLTLRDVDGGRVAFQNGIPVPSFNFQPRPRIDLGGLWRAERRAFDSDLSLTPRAAALDRLVADARGRESPDFDDRSWATVSVPGSLNPPPDRDQTGGWYRRDVFIPAIWTERAVTLKFGAVNYLADVWLNGVHLGYHEGGHTPFAFDATPALRPGATNIIAVRVDNPEWGRRNDIVPWGLADWWNFAGITRDVWFEASDPAHVVRADVTPHLDGADVSIVIENRSAENRTVGASIEILAATVDEGNLTDPDPRSLIARDAPIGRHVLLPLEVGPNAALRRDANFTFAAAATWSPARPALYVLRVRLTDEAGRLDELVDTFGLRQVSVDQDAPIIRLNGDPLFLAGVALHDHQIAPSGTAGERARISSVTDIIDQLDRARSIGAQLIRTGHTPANPLTLMLADRIGFAVWEEIPLYHYTPLTFKIAMPRGIPQQMLREMALRDMNRPSVLFHGLANESTGETERTDALRELRDVDRAIDGTRLTGQAAYGFQPTDASNEPLDVAGFTLYYGVFYGDDPAVGTRQALEEAHARFPTKPVVVLEFGRWADGADGPAQQRRILDATLAEILGRRATRQDGYVATAVWWTLEDYYTLRPQLEIEHFGLFRPDGTARPAAEGAATRFAQVATGVLADEPVVSTGRAARSEARQGGFLLALYVVYGAVASFVILALVLVLLLRRGGRVRHRLPLAGSPMPRGGPP